MTMDGFEMVTSRGGNFYGPYTVVFTENGDTLTKARHVMDDHMRSGGKAAVILQNKEHTMCMVKLFF